MADRRVRPYVITRGRTRVPGHDVPLEASVLVAGRRPLPADSAPEVRRIVALCTRPHSVAELAAHTGVPLGVARVLVSDLRRDGHVTTGAVAPDGDDDRVRILERLLEGVRAL